MKKIIVLLLSLMLMAACSSGTTTPESTVASKTCSIEESGMTLSIKAEAPSEDANAETVEIAMFATYESMGLSAEDLDDETKELMSSVMESYITSSFAESFGSEETMEVTKNEFTDEGLDLAITMNIKEALGDDMADVDLSLTSFVEEMELSGFSCQ